MTTQELRELDAWISTNIMNFCRIDTKRGGHYRCFYRLDTITGGIQCGGFRSMEQAQAFLNCHIPKYTTDPAAAMDVLKKCAEKTPQLMISTHGGRWIIGDNTLDSLVKSETLELAICLFAKQLFSQTTK